MLKNIFLPDFFHPMLPWTDPNDTSQTLLGKLVKHPKYTKLNNRIVSDNQNR
jgi:hypothetical protein